MARKDSFPRQRLMAQVGDKDEESGCITSSLTRGLATSLKSTGPGARHFDERLIGAMKLLQIHRSSR